MGGLGVRFMIEGESGSNFALVEHPIEPHTLAAPIHTHLHEDEYTYVLEGEIGVQVGDEVCAAQPGDLVLSLGAFLTPSGTRQTCRHERWRLFLLRALNATSRRWRSCSPLL
ncbi:MAG TPA: cupin domain-containing protein, partial [Rubrobacteraceae bacterium]|nr:cupin domain-containing protein [Rubrobacteraceae bacterium]